MGNYATTTSIRHVLVNFYRGNAVASDPEGASTASHHIANAEAQVNAALAARYSMPFSTIPPEVRRMSEQIACYNILKAMSWQDQKQKNVYLDEFKTALNDLSAYAKGDMRLTYTDGSLVPVLSTRRIMSSTKNYTPIFGIDDAENWQPSQRQVDDQADARDQ